MLLGFPLHARIEMVLQNLENSTYVDARVTQCWLRDFLDYIHRTKELSVGADDDNSTTSTSSSLLDISTEESFARTLREVYLADPWAENSLDVAYSDDGKRVVAARFLIQVGRCGRQTFDNLPLLSLHCLNSNSLRRAL